MSCEIEIKAHLKTEQIESILDRIKKMDNCRYLGPIDKYDIYWSYSENGEPKFRTRLENSDGGARVLFTQKPLKSKDYCTEYNVENEFEVSASEWDNIQIFCRGINLQICRVKYKNGYHFELNFDNFLMHCEILNVKYLGWFIETEICGQNLDEMDKEGADMALYHLLGVLDVAIDAVEPKGYNKMLKEIGHDKG